MSSASSYRYLRVEATTAQAPSEPVVKGADAYWQQRVTDARYWREEARHAIGIVAHARVDGAVAQGEIEGVGVVECIAGVDEDRTLHADAVWHEREREADFRRGRPEELAAKRILPAVADALGLTSVHVSRTLRWFEKEGIVSPSRVAAAAHDTGCTPS